MIDYINKQGLSTAIDKLKELCCSKGDAADILAVVQQLADIVESPETSITIPSSSWVSGISGDYKVYKDVAISGITATDGIEVILPPASLSVAKNCGLCPNHLRGKIL